MHTELAHLVYGQSLKTPVYEINMYSCTQQSRIHWHPNSKDLRALK